MDCEGLSKERKLQLLQIYYANTSYLIDMVAVNPFKYGLREVMESHQVMKLFHDFCEDSSVFVRQYNLVCNFVFDTQVAHRLISDFF